MKRLIFVLAVMSSLAIGLISPGALGMVSPALGQPSFQDEWGVRIHFQDPENPIEITDLSGTTVGQGTHVGQLRCEQTCNHKAQLQLNGIEYQYRFETIQALDPVEGLVIVAGRGTISNLGQKDRFLFTATLENNQDGTVWVRYDASRPDASFIIPNAPGTFTFFSKH